MYDLRITVFLLRLSWALHAVVVKREGIREGANHSWRRKCGLCSGSSGQQSSQNVLLVNAGFS